MSGCYVYMLLARDGSLYTGIAADPVKRLAQHNAGSRGAKALRGKRPVRLLRCWLCGDRSAALRLEAELKRLRAKEKWSVVLGNDSSRSVENDGTRA
jgi:putative endonuclease